MRTGSPRPAPSPAPRLGVERLEGRECPAAYQYDVIARTGSGLVSIGAGASANDYGRTAFVANNDAGQSVYVVRGAGEPVLVSFDPPSPTRTYGAELQINNDGFVAAVDNDAVSTPQRRAREWSSNEPGLNAIVARSSVPPANGTYFDSLGLYASISNGARVAVAGLNGSFWEVHRTAALTTPGDAPTTVATLSSSTFFRPLAADGNRTLLGWRTAATKRVTLYDNPAGTAIAFQASTASGYTDLGVRPGVSDDGRAVAFYGADANGPGVFFALCPPGATATVRRVAGVSGNGRLDPLETFADLNGNGNFDPPTETDTGPFAGFGVDTRVAVEHAVGAAGKDLYTLAFLGTPAGGGTALFTVQANALTPGAVTPSQPLAIIGVGATVAGLTGAVQSISITDPLNANGDVTFVTDHGGGVQAVLRASLLDSDGDGLFDVWETSGIDLNGDGTPEVDLPAMGANPFRKDLFVELDAMTGFAPVPSAATYAIPAGLKTNTALDGVVDAFYHSPVGNPPLPPPFVGPPQPGVNLHVIVDDTNVPAAQWGNATAAGWPAEFDALKQARFGTAAERADATGLKLLAKRLAFRYCVFADSFEYTTPGGAVTRNTSGVSESPGNDFVVTLGGPNWASSPTRGDDQAGTFMHELGHTLGLRHGGDDEDNFKPNYRSVMNYTWQTPARLTVAGTPSAALSAYHNAWRLNYSRGTRNVLVEAALDETTGIGGDPGVMVPIGVDTFGRLVLVPEGGPADFDQVGGYTVGATADVNNLDGTPTPGQVLADHDDWSALIYDFRRTGDFADGSHGSADVSELTADLVIRLSQAAQLVPDAHVAEFRVNDGAVQRSRVTGLRVTLDRPVTLSAGNFALSGFAGTLSVTSTVAGGQTVAVITFAGGTLQSGSLADGRYTLNVSGVPGLAGPTAFAFHRLFGDSDGDADVDAVDLLRFRQAFGTSVGQANYRVGFDADGDGDVDAADLAAFRLRFGSTLP